MASEPFGIRSPTPNHNRAGSRSGLTRNQEASMKSLRICFLIFTAVTIVAPCAHAQFGSGVVYDPTQSGHAIVQISQGEQQLQKWATELQKWEQHLQKEE